MALRRLLASVSVGLVCAAAAPATAQERFPAEPEGGFVGAVAGGLAVSGLPAPTFRLDAGYRLPIASPLALDILGDATFTFGTGVFDTRYTVATVGAAMRAEVPVVTSAFGVFLQSGASAARLSWNRDQQSLGGWAFAPILEGGVRISVVTVSARWAGSSQYLEDTGGDVPVSREIPMGLRVLIGARYLFD